MSYRSLRHLFSHLDGTTTDPRSFDGPLGKQLSNCEVLEIVAFEPVALNSFPAVDEQDISADQKYLIKIAIGISNGSVSQELAQRKPGPVNHARWLTMASRLLRLSVSTIMPSAALQLIVKFLMKYYIPLWLTIKVENTCSE
jgi:hypothetical protein